MANDKTEKATPKKKRDTRQKGQVAKSQDVVDWAMVLTGMMVVPSLVRHMADDFAHSLFQIRRVTADPSGGIAVEALGEALRHGLLVVLPLLLVAVITSVVASVGQSGLLLTGKPLKPDPKRINPIAGFKRLFSPQSAWTTGKQMLRMVIVAAISIPRVRGIVDDLAGHGRVPLREGMLIAADRTAGLIRLVAFWMLILALADYGYQRWQFARKIRMTKQEIRDEYKQAEGDGMVKGRIRAMQRAMSRNRMMADIPSANVVVTNPTHIAVALRYDPMVSRAPKVVAVGAGAVAARIRAAATEAKVPIVEAKPLARALWRACEVGDDIPVVLYEAVAKVLAFVHRLDKRFGVDRQLELPRSLQVDETVLDAVGRKKRRGGRRRPSRPAVKAEPRPATG
jgi:flagellar biosynthetic protein FlhB